MISLFFSLFFAGLTLGWFAGWGWAFALWTLLFGALFYIRHILR